MSEQFKEQGGAATMDPSKFRRWVTSKMMTRMSGEPQQHKTRARAEAERRKRGQRHRVDYFHQPGDGYSYLAAQILPQLAERYDIELHCHLVSSDADENTPEPELLTRLSRYDASLIAPYYGLEFPAGDQACDSACLTRALTALSGLDSRQFVEYAAAVERALWRNDIAGLDEMIRLLGHANDTQVSAALTAGNALRARLKHYSGAMFYYGGEWYWGIDRLYHLERRLAELGLDQTPDQPLLADYRAVAHGPLQDDGSLTLEVFPSLRSPYTAIAFDRTLQLAEQTGINLVVRPVLPMVMRGVPATMEKGKYILFDTGREARAAGVPFGPCYDPIGEPTRRAYSIYQWACEQGKGNEFISQFLRCAWSEAINTNTDRGLRDVVVRAGLDWEEAKPLVGKPGWEKWVEQNRQAMYDLGLWGVPSYRLLNPQGKQLLAVWGQDRLWLVAQKIQEQLQG